MTHNSRYRKQKWVRQFSPKALGIILFALVLLILTGSGFAYGGNAKYIILLIGDGWGPKHIEAVNKYTGATPLYQSGSSWVKYMVSTFPEGGSYNTTQAWSDFNYVNTTPDTQDSACTASSIYSGSKTSPGRMSVSSNASTRLFTIGERAKELGKAVGAISTVPASHATPGAWVAHNDSRINTFAIADEGFFGDPNTTGTVVTDTKYGGGHGPTMPPADVMIGGNVTNYISNQILDKLRTESGQTGKHVLVERQTRVDGGDALMFAANNFATLKLAGLFNQVDHNADGGGYNSDNPTLSESVLATVKVLSRNPNGFVLMVEGGAIDWGSHANNMNRVIGEAKDFDNAVQTVTDWVDDPGNDATWNNTLVIVTADHECGYLTAGPGVLPDQPLGNVNSTTLFKEKIVLNTGGRRASWEDTNSNNIIDPGETVYWYWNSGAHTNSLVPLYARGTGSELFVNYAINSDLVRGLYLDNTNVFSVMNSAIASTGTAANVVFVQQPTDATAGAAISPAVTVQLQDGSGNNVSTSGVSVTMSLSSGTGALSGTTVQTTNASGLATFNNLSINLAGSKNLTATSAGLTSAVSNAFTISAGTATKVVFAQQPTDATAGAAISPAVTVQLQDGSGNNVSTSGVSVTMSLSSGTGALSGTTVQTTNASGLATFNNLSINLAGSKNLTATSAGLTSAVSNAFTISAGTATKVVFAQQPTDATAGAAISPAVTVQLQDGSGNNVSTSGVSVTMSLSSGTGSLSGTTAQTTNASGLATFNDLSIDLAGSKNLTAASTGLTPAASDSFTISAVTAANVVFVQQPTDATAGAAISPAVTVQLQDGSGNNVSTSGVSVTMSLSSGTGALSGTTVQTTDASGLATFSDLSIDLAGAKNLTATSEGLTSAVSDSFTILAGTAAKVRVETAADGSGIVVPLQSIVSGSSITVYAITRDASDNFVANVAADAWSLESITNDVISGDLVSGGDNKSAVFTGHFSGTAEIKATSGSLVTTNSGTLTVTAGVSLTSPANNETGVAINRAITATFTEAMDASTITTATFTVSDGSNISGVVSYSGTTATFTPSGNLSPSTTYTATITTGAKDLVGNSMATPYTWSFTTGTATDTTPPTVSSTSPADGATGVSINSAITATFSETMSISTITTATFTVSDGGGTISGEVSYSGTTATFTPLSNLSPSTTYTATITTGVEDLAGNAMASTYVWSFTTGTATDTTSPTVSSTSPADGAADVAINTAITATFSEAMSTSTITTATFTVSDGVGTIGGAVSYSDMTATFTPLSNLYPSTTYTATITTGVEDLAGNAMATNSTWSFTTSEGTATKVVFVQQPSDTTAGGIISPAVTVQLQDALGNNVSTSGVSVAMSLSSGEGVLSGTTVQTTDASGLATFNNLSINLEGSKNLTATSDGLTSAVSNAFTISAGAATRVVFVQQPSNTTSGAAISPAVTVQLQDALGNNVSTSGVSVAMSLSSGEGVLSGTTVQTTDASGLATFSDLSIDLAGSKNLTATSEGLTLAVSDAFAISAGTATKVVFVQQPTDATAGSIISPAVTVQLQDALGNNVSTSGVSVTMLLSSGTGALSGTTVQTTNASGLATFNNLSINLAGSKNLTATSAGLTSAVSNAFTISAGTATKVVFAQQPTDATAGAAISPAVTVQLQDGSGNNVSTSGVSVTMSLSSGTGALSGTTVQTTNASGLATFNNLSINLAGSKNLTATSAGLTSAVSNAFTISDPTLQAHYAFDEGTGATATDSSGNNRNGTITGATWTTGKIGGALNFDGNDYVTIPSMNYDEISVSAWFNKNASGTNVIFGGCRYNANVQLQEGFDLYFNSGTPNRLRFVVVTRNTSGTRTVKDATKDFTDSNGSWYHVVGTYNKTTGEQKLYVDGQLVNTETHPSGNVIVPLTERNYMAIGTRYTDWGFFRGIIDDIRIYNRALSAQEVLSLFNNATTPDTTPPTVSATSPVSDATEVAVNSAITGTFSEAMDASSITTATFLVSDGSSNIGGAVSYSGTTATFIPSGNLSSSTTYTATITTGVKDVAGNGMTADYVWSFTTGAPDTTPPTVSATSPVSDATEVAVNSAITGTFSEAMDASSITTATFLVSDGSSNIGGAVSYSGTTATFIPSGNLSSSTIYTATITTGVKDVAGNEMAADYVWSFTTGAAPDPALQAHYAFDEGSGTTATDSSGNNSDGTITGATWTTGKISGALNFDGNDYVTIPSMNYDEISVSAWFNKNASGTNVIFGGCRYNANVQLQEGFDLYFNSGTPNRLRFVVVTRNTSGTRTVKDATKDFTDSNGSWYHVVGTYNKTTGEQKLYVDGQLVDTQTHPSGNVIVPLTERNYMAIGTRYTDWGFFRGIIDDIRIYNRALSAQEVLSLFNNATTPDTTPPTVSATSPVSDATEVAVNSAITGTFSEAMDASSITTATFLVSDGSSNIGGAVSYSGTTATFIPSGNLSSSTTYTATITTGVKDVAGNGMTADYVWSFTTGAPDTTPPTVSATSPVSDATEVAVNSAITGTFSEAMDASSITTATFLVSDGSSNIGGAVSYSGTTATFIPSGNLSSSTTYTATITTGVKDVAGNGMTADYVWSFTTGAPDTTPPTVSATSPVSDATEVAVNSAITGTFSEAMDASSITTATFLVSDGSSNIGGAVSYSGTTATFIPSGNLSSSTTYTATITTGVKDVAGNGMIADYVWSFTTGAATDPTLQAHYAFDEGSGTIASDSSGNNRNGTITGATWTTGKIGGALNFDGNDYVTIPSMNYDEISVSAWFNKNASGTNVIFGGCRYNANVQLQEGFDLYFNSGTPNRLRFVVVTRNTSGTRTVKDATKDFTDSNGSWYHVVGTYNKTTGEQKLYVDGQLVDTQTHPSGNVIVPLTERNYMAIGTRYTDWGFFRGIIDDVRIYNRELSDQEVLSSFAEQQVIVQSLKQELNDTVSSDITPPEVSETSPFSNATGVAVDSTITAMFSETMYASSITTATFMVSDESGAIGGTVSYSGTTATFAPSGPLAYSTTYTAKVTTGAKDLVDNAMASDYIWSFTTDDMSDSTTVTATNTTSLSEDPGGKHVHYAFNEGKGAIAKDYSDNNKNGTITGLTGSTWTTGKFGKALSFNGASTYVSIPPLNYDEISVSAWFYRYSVDTAEPDTIFGGWSWNSGGQGYGLYFDQYSSSANTIRFIVTSKTSEGTKTQKHATMDLVTSTGKWYHVAGTYNKTTGKQKLYVDGQLVDTQAHPAGNTIVPYTAASYMAIGALTSDYGHIDAKIDEVRVYNRALSAGEVLSLRFYNTTTSDITPLVRITTPDNYYLQENSDLSVQAETNNLHQKQGILFVLDSGTAYERSISDYTAPYEVVFTNLSRGEYVMDAFVVDADGNRISGDYAHDKRVQIGIGDYYWGMGDGITRGSGDDDVSDDTSQDGRNAGGGYLPILNNLLTAARGYPHTVFNEGVGGATSSDGASSINRLLLRHPNASRCLVQYGTNDANPFGLPIPSGLGLNPDDPGYPGTFKDNMQKILDAINAAGQKVCLAKSPIALGDSSGTYQDPDQAPGNILIKEYNQVIDELKNSFSNNILVIPPDFYSYFNYSDVPTERRRYEDEYADTLHPNGIGYRSMSNLWFQALTQ